MWLRGLYFCTLSTDIIASSLQVLAANNRNVKALFRKGQAECGLKNFDQALVHLNFYLTHVRIKTILGKVPLQSPKNNHVQFYIVLKVKLSMSFDVRLSINVSVIKAQGSNKFLDLTFLKILHASIHFLLHV